MALAAALFGTLSYVTRNADELGMGALPFIAWRGAVATVAMLPVLWLASRRSGNRAGIGQLAPNRRRALIAAALIGAALNIAMFQAFLLTTIAVVLICFYTFPAMVTLAAVPLYGERIDRVRASGLILSAVGLVLVVLVPVLNSAEVRIDPLGIALAFGAGVCQASFILIVGRGFDLCLPQEWRSMRCLLRARWVWHSPCSLATSTDYSFRSAIRRPGRGSSPVGLPARQYRPRHLSPASA